MKGLLIFAWLILLIGCTPPEIENAEKAEIRYCRNCITIRDAINYEETNGSVKEDLKPVEIGSNNGKTISRLYFYERDNEVGPIDTNVLLYKRESSLKDFSEYIFYGYFTGSGAYPDSTLYHAGKIDFNLGPSALGFKDGPKHDTSIPYLLKDVNPISIVDFKKGYYSILKWLYSLETDKRKVVKSKIDHFDKDKYSSPEVKLEDMALEDPWQEEFLFHKYELKGDDDYSYFVSIEPKTYAPITLYEERPEYLELDNKYHINISDMVIRISFSAEFTGLDKAL